MKNKKIVTLIATLGLITCLYTKVDAVKFYDTMGTRYEGAVERLGALGIINGISDKTFSPNKTVTRAEFAKMIVEASLTEEEIWSLTIDDSKCTFSDVSSDKWYYKYVVVAVNYGYINGYDDNTFKPDAEITYEQATKMFMKALGHNYLVETDPRGWSAEYMDKMYSLNIADGTTEFKKNDPATRGNIAIMLWNTFVSNIWEKIELNDTNGFTYIDSGRTMFNKKTKGYVYKDDFKINGFKEINGKLNVKIDNIYHQFYDQDVTITFSMLGGNADGLLRYVRYPQSRYQYEMIGLSTNPGAQVYEGTFEELKEDGNPIKNPTFRVGSDADYGYVIKAENEEENRSITINSQGQKFYVEEIRVDEDKESIEKDEEDVIKEIENSDNDYVYKNTDEVITKKITINEDYVIEDGAVLFENNKRVDWRTVKKGDVITEIKKNEYYFLSRDVIETTVNKYVEKDDSIEFYTPNGIIEVYNNAKCIEYYSEDSEARRIERLKKDELDSLKGIKVAFFLDFTGKAVRMEVLENNIEDKKISSIKELNLAYFSEYTQSGTDNNYISLYFDENEKTIRTTLKGINVDPGDLVLLEYNDRNIITKMTRVDKSSNLSDKFKIKTISYNELKNFISNKEITDKMPMYATKYYYDFGEYDKITDFKVKNINLDDIDNYNSEKIECFIVTDDADNIKTVLIKDYSERRETFYGKVNRIYSENKEMKIIISIFEHKEITYNVSGLLNCEEGDVISFKIENKDTIKVLEKYTTNVLGYYKDIIIKDISYKKEVDSENGEVYLDEGKIVVGKKEYKISEFDVILLKLKKDDKGLWTFSKGDIIEIDDIVLERNDRIAINEIEDTIIIYRGYKDK